MRKKITLMVLVVAILIQLLVPVGMIVHCLKAESDLEEYGVEYKFKINADSIYNGTLFFELEDGWYRWQEDEYGLISVDDEGYAYFETFVENRPPIHSYVRFTEDNKKKLRQFDIDNDIEEFWVADEESYAIIKIFNGDIQVVEIFIDGVNANDWSGNPPVEYVEDENLFENT